MVIMRAGNSTYSFLEIASQKYHMGELVCQDHTQLAKIGTFSAQMSNFRTFQGLKNKSLNFMTSEDRENPGKQQLQVRWTARQPVCAVSQ